MVADLLALDAPPFGLGSAILLVMRKDESGKDCPATLGEYRDLCAALGGVECRAVKFLDERIAAQGREAVVLAADSQMRALLFPMLLATTLSFHDLPLSSFPVKLSLLHCVTREVLWSTVVEAPARGKAAVRIPDRGELGGPVIARAEFGDGTVMEDEPPGGPSLPV